ncbi:MAG TPA: hypothetical protein VD864_04170, partial [Nocardioides sp.]|nr:hypothetical protein [Nocardioides sp.]
MRPGTGPARRTAALAVGAVLLLSGCGSDDPAPSEAVPALARHLDAVDTAVASGRYDDARTALQSLVAAAAQAEVDGRV